MKRQWDRKNQTKDGRYRVVPVYRGCETAQEWKLIDTTNPENTHYFPTLREAKEFVSEFL